MGAYIDVNEGDWDSNVLQSDVPVLVDFWAPWCGPCRAIAPNVEALAEEYAGRLKVAKVNVDNNQALAMKYGIRGIPALLVFKGGDLVNQVSGVPGGGMNGLKGLVDPVL